MTVIQIRGKGTITLPAELRRKYNLEEGESLTLVDMGGVFVISPQDSKVVRSADRVAKKVSESNVSLDELLDTLDEERSRYYRDHYVEENLP